MQLVIAVEQRFERTPGGELWTSSNFSHEFWTRYLVVFEQVRIVARIRAVESVPENFRRADGPSVTFTEIPYYIGPREYLSCFYKVKHALSIAVGTDDAILLRVPSTLATQIVPLLRNSGRPYALQAVGDPYDVFAPGAVQHPLRAFFRWWFTQQLKRQCRYALATAYVNRQTLPHRYPCPGYVDYFSDVEISRAARVDVPRSTASNKGPWRLLLVGSLEQLYKSPELLIEAVGICVHEGLDLHLNIVGEGKFRMQLETQAANLGLKERINFLGQLPDPTAVRNEMDKVHLFVLPSKTEGLPRAMIEAMARALPCVGSTVGGIPELLPAEDMVPPGDADALANKIREVLSDPHRMALMSARNHEKAREEYSEEVLQKRRTAFYQHLRNTTEAWLGSRAKEGTA